MNSVKLKRVNGVLKIDIDGRIYEPLSFKSFRPTERNISDFYHAGVKLFSILTAGLNNMLNIPYSLFGDSWLDDGIYDFEPIDKQIELFRKNAPGCYFALMIQLDTRPWYCEKHHVPYTFTCLSQTAADEAWREAAANYMKAVIRHVEEKFGDEFYGYFLLCGYTTEWFSQYDEQAASASKTAAYRKYLKNPSAEIPTKEAISAPADQAFLPDEIAKENRVYQEFHAELIADAILHFAKEAQTVLQHKKLLGVYYGYLFELFGSRLWNAGSLAYEKVFTSEDIDMISSPSSYAYRTVDSTSAFMVTHKTLDDRNKLYYLEFDHITHLSPPKVGNIYIPGGESKLKNQVETLNVMQRDYMLCLANGAALWWFDMFEGWFYSHEMMNAIAQMIRISNKLSKIEMHSVSEILVLSSGRSLYAVNKESLLNNYCLGDMREGLARMGAPYDSYSICDLSHIDFSRYKLIILLDPFDFSEEERKFVSELKRNGRTVLSIYAPDYVDFGIEGMTSFTKMNITEFPKMEAEILFEGQRYTVSQMPSPRFAVDDEAAETLACYAESRKPAVSRMKDAEGVSVYSAVGNLPAELLRKIAEDAGVKIFSYDTQAPVYINSRIIGVYAPSKTEIFLKNGHYIDLFTGSVYENTTGILHLPKTEYASKLLMKTEDEL